MTSKISKLVISKIYQIVRDLSIEDMRSYILSDIEEPYIIKYQDYVEVIQDVSAKKKFIDINTIHQVLESYLHLDKAIMLVYKQKYESLVKTYAKTRGNINLEEMFLIFQYITLDCFIYNCWYDDYKYQMFIEDSDLMYFQMAELFITSEQSNSDIPRLKEGYFSIIDVMLNITVKYSNQLNSKIKIAPLLKRNNSGAGIKLVNTKLTKNYSSQSFISSGGLTPEPKNPVLKIDIPLIQAQSPNVKNARSLKTSPNNFEKLKAIKNLNITKNVLSIESDAYYSSIPHEDDNEYYDDDGNKVITPKTNIDFNKLTPNLDSNNDLESNDYVNSTKFKLLVKKHPHMKTLLNTSIKNKILSISTPRDKGKDFFFSSKSESNNLIDSKKKSSYDTDSINSDLIRDDHKKEQINSIIEDCNKTLNINDSNNITIIDHEEKDKMFVNDDNDIIEIDDYNYNDENKSVNMSILSINRSVYSDKDSVYLSKSDMRKTMKESFKINKEDKDKINIDQLENKSKRDSVQSIQSVNCSRSEKQRLSSIINESKSNFEQTDNFETSIINQMNKNTIDNTDLEIINENENDSFDRANSVESFIIEQETSNLSLKDDKNVKSKNSIDNIINQSIISRKTNNISNISNYTNKLNNLDNAFNKSNLISINQSNRSLDKSKIANKSNNTDKSKVISNSESIKSLQKSKITDKSTISDKINNEDKSKVISNSESIKSLYKSKITDKSNNADISKVISNSESIKSLQKSKIADKSIISDKSKISKKSKIADKSIESLDLNKSKESKKFKIIRSSESPKPDSKIKSSIVNNKLNKNLKEKMTNKVKEKVNTRKLDQSMNAHIKNKISSATFNNTLKVQIKNNLSKSINNLNVSYSSNRKISGNTFSSNNSNSNIIDKKIKVNNNESIFNDSNQLKTKKLSGNEFNSLQYEEYEKLKKDSNGTLHSFNKNLNYDYTNQSVKKEYNFNINQIITQMYYQDRYIMHLMDYKYENVSIKSNFQYERYNYSSTSDYSDKIYIVNGQLGQVKRYGKLCEYSYIENIKNKGYKQSSDKYFNISLQDQIYITENDIMSSSKKYYPKDILNNIPSLTKTESFHDDIYSQQSFKIKNINIDLDSNSKFYVDEDEKLKYIFKFSNSRRCLDYNMNNNYDFTNVQIKNNNIIKTTLNDNYDKRPNSIIYDENYIEDLYRRLKDIIYGNLKYDYVFECKERFNKFLGEMKSRRNEIENRIARIANY